jgi:biopolymer transport protein ExbD
MRIGNDRRGDEFEINVIPLIDVLLTLLMFFVLTSTFVQHSRMQLTLPNASATERDANSPALTITVDHDGRFFVGSDEVAGADVAALKQSIARVAGDDRERSVTIRADAKSSHQSVVIAMDALGQLGFTKLSIATTPAKDSKSK